ncbi:MAG: RpiB/LacA/LacB family sugar-phosphate isomerase [Candidatus Pacebacteria bacterium]|nr:RpiB/LacA/LacB family sugar-phosphate isomerase [Candidatus Paceibacterota bacterium]
MKIVIAADHRGFYLKEDLKEWLQKLGHQVIDSGNHEYDQTDDYVDFASKAALQVAEDFDIMGIFFCGSGAGVSITANKIKGIRACIGITREQVESAKADDDLNVLVIAADYTGQDRVKEMIEVFLSTPFKGEERHVRRLQKIKDLEK